MCGVGWRTGGQGEKRETRRREGNVMQETYIFEKRMSKKKREACVEEAMCEGRLERARRQASPGEARTEKKVMQVVMEEEAYLRNE